MPRFAHVAWARLLVCLLLAAGCAPSPYQPRFGPTDSDGHQLRDAEGRARLYRGVNVHITGIFDVTFADGRAPREPLIPFDAHDVLELRQRGLNLLRLPINWSAIEPQRGVYSEKYLDDVAAIVALCRAQSIDVLVDLHQDGWSKELCEDGAPLWAVVPQPSPPLPGGPVQGPDCHASPAALHAFDEFWANTDNLQEAYLDMLAHVAARFRDDPAVMGYEIMNEPIGVDDTVQAFQMRAARRLRDTDPKKLVVFEPVATRNFINGAPLSATPFPVAGSVYAVHIYTAIFGDDGSFEAGTYGPKLKGSIDGAREEADAWGTPLLVTEYGLGSGTPNGPSWIRDAHDDFDSVWASTTYWLWKDPNPNPGAWGLFDPQPDGSFTERKREMSALVRPYAQAIGGNPTSMLWDGATLVVRFEGRGDVPARHDVFWNQGTPTIVCDGKTIAPDVVDTDGSIYVVRCGGAGAHTLTFSR